MLGGVFDIESALYGGTARQGRVSVNGRTLEHRLDWLWCMAALWQLGCLGAWQARLHTANVEQQQQSGPPGGGGGGG